MKRIFPLLIAAALNTIPAKASACAVCMGDPNPNVIAATNGTLWMLLSLVGLMFLGTAFTVFYIWRRATTPLPPHVQLMENLTTEPEEC
jgi:hypothetical protein